MTTTSRASLRSGGSLVEVRDGHGLSDAARQVNERFRARRDPHADCAFVALCECGRRGCRSGVELTIAEYDAICWNTACYIVVGGHKTSSQVLVHTTERYLLVTFEGARAGSQVLGLPGSA